MSRESSQAMISLSVICGIMQTMRQERCFAKVELQRAIDAVYLAAADAVRDWPVMTRMQTVRQKLRDFTASLDSLDKEQYPAVELVKMADTLCTDLEERYTVGLRNRLLVGIRPGLDLLMEHVDRHGRNFPAWEESEKIIGGLYAIIGFEPA